MQAQKKDYIWNSIGSFLQSAISPILLIVITRLNGVGDSGLFSFAMSLSVVFWAISLWGGRTYQVSDVKKEFSNGDYIVVRFISSLIVAVFSISFCILSGYDLIKTELIMVLVSFKILESIADSMYGVLQIHNKLYIVGISLTIKSVFGFIIFAIVDILTKNIVHGALSIFIVNIAVVIFYDIPWMKHVESVGLTKKNIMQAEKVMKKTAEVFVIVFLTMFSLNIPRYFLDKYHYDQIGYFGIMAMPITLLTLFISFVLQPNVVNLSELLKKKKIKEFTKIVSKIDFITFTLGILFVISSYLIGVWILNIVFGIDINNFRIDLTIMVIGAVANAFVSIYVNLLIILRRFKGQFYTLLVTNILAVVLSVYLIDRLAMLGSVLVFMIISFLQAIILLFIYKRSLKNVIMLNEDKVRYE